MSGHTEGPFRVIEFRGFPCIAGPAWTEKDPYSHRVAEMVCWSNGLGPTRDEARAIAHRFAAAPLLLAELKRLVEALEPLERDGGWPLDGAGIATLNAARAAIAAAEPRP